MILAANSQNLLETAAITTLVSCLKNGGVIAYPTEAVFGLGCDAMNESAVRKILKLKQRSVQQGLIVLAPSLTMVKQYCGELPPTCWQTITPSWPGPNTWLLPANSSVPTWISGQHTTVAMRISAHPIVQQILQAWPGLLVSSSANRHGETPALNVTTLTKYFPTEIDIMIDAPLGTEKKPSTIRDALSGKLIRR